VATEAAWLNGEKVRKTHGESKTLLTGIGLLMEGTTLAVATSGAVTPNVYFRVFDTNELVLLAALSGCIMRVSFPLSRYPGQLFLRGIQKGERP
jgi:hypothetical protein